MRVTTFLSFQTSLIKYIKQKSDCKTIYRKIHQLTSKSGLNLFFKFALRNSPFHLSKTFENKNLFSKNQIPLVSFQHIYCFIFFYVYLYYLDLYFTYNNLIFHVCASNLEPNLMNSVCY